MGTSTPMNLTAFQLNTTRNILKTQFNSCQIKFNSSINVAAKNVVDTNMIQLNNVNSTRSLNKNDSLYMEHAPQLTVSTLIKVYVLLFMAFVSLIGNVLTLWNIYKTRKMRLNSRPSASATYSLIFHLSIADLLVTFFCIIGDAVWYYTVQWLANDFICRSLKLLQMFSLYLSTYILVLIGMDRWMAIKYPMKSLYMGRCFYHSLVIIYILALALSLPQSFIFHVARGPFIEEFYQCVTYGFYTSKWQEQMYTTSTLIFIFFLPLIIIIFTYISTYTTIKTNEKMFQTPISNLCSNNIDDCFQSYGHTRTNRRRLLHKAKMKSLRMSIVIIVAFVICWTPYNVMMMIFMFWNPNEIVSEHLQSAIFFFGMSNSLVNPLIYGAFHVSTINRKKALRKSLTQNYKMCSFNGRDSRRTTSTMLTISNELDCFNDSQMRNLKRFNYQRSISLNDRSSAVAERSPIVALSAIPQSDVTASNNFNEDEEAK